MRILHWYPHPANRQFITAVISDNEAIYSVLAKLYTNPITVVAGVGLNNTILDFQDLVTSAIDEVESALRDGVYEGAFFSKVPPEGVPFMPHTSLIWIKYSGTWYAIELQGDDKFALVYADLPNEHEFNLYGIAVHSKRVTNRLLELFFTLPKANV